MKKIIIVLSLITFISCNKDVPKCEDKEILGTVISLLSENSMSLIDNYGRNSVMIDTAKAEIDNIMTTSTNPELNSCGCEGTLILPNHEGIVKYSAQKNSEGEIIVKVDDAGPFQFKL